MLQGRLDDVHTMIIHLFNFDFYKYILRNWVEFCNSVKIESVYTFLDAPLWYSRNLRETYLYIHEQ